MARTIRERSSGENPTRKDGQPPQKNQEQRRSNISRTVTKLLRHQAQNEKVPISPQGWVNMDDLLSWRGLSDKQKFNPAVTIGDIFDVVEDDGKFGKGRFGLRYVGEGDAISQDDQVVDAGIGATATGEMVELTAELKVEDNAAAMNQTFTEPPVSVQQQSSTPVVVSRNNHTTVLTISHFRANPSTESTSYFIRATQGHSIKAIESEGLLSPITLKDPNSIPDTVVHGTFYGAWDSIISSGGLKAMGRNLVHFATGPSLTELLPAKTVAEDLASNTDTNEGTKLTTKKDVDEMLGKNKVISGMRWDAQILIYIDLKRCLEDVRDSGSDMTWFKSENSVILTEGLVVARELESDDQKKNVSHEAEGVKRNKQSKKRHVPRPEDKLVPVKYWSAAVEIKEGLGVIWRASEGIVQELPERLKNKPLPHGKKGHGPKGGQGAKHAKEKPKSTNKRCVIGAEDVALEDS